MSKHSRKWIAPLAWIAVAAVAACSSTVEGVQGQGGSDDAGVDASADADVTSMDGDNSGVDDVGADASASDAEDAGAEDVGMDDAGPEDVGLDDAGPGDVGLDDTGAEDVGQDTADSDPWTGTPCSVNGRAGVCMDVEACGVDMVATPGFCPGPSHIQCCTEAPQMGGSCDEDAMPTPNEGLSEAPGVGGCPSGMIPVNDSFCVDTYEAALVEVLEGGQERHWSPFFNPGERRVRAFSAAGAVPQGYINQRQATDACAEAGKRLCAGEEWLRACQGPQALTFPYGDTRQGGVCNDARGVHPAVEYFGTSEDWIFGQIDNPCLNQLDDGLALTGDHAGCVSAEGALDMMGNLHEWTADPSGTFRGGFYVDTVINGPGCLYRTTAHSVGHWDYSTGFRCCADR